MSERLQPQANERERLNTLMRDVFIIRPGRAGLWLANQVVARGSTIGSQVIYDSSLFPWTKDFEDNWQTVRKELDEVLKNSDSIPQFMDVSNDLRYVNEGQDWKTYFFYGLGHKDEAHCEVCPETSRLIGQVPEITTAFFSIFAPGTTLKPHRGMYGGFLRYHLGLKVPEPVDSCGIEVDGQTYNWREGESFVFDDSYKHSAWNNSDSSRVVLFADFKRPLRSPFDAINNKVIDAIGNSSFIKNAMSRYEKLASGEIPR